MGLCSTLSPASPTARLVSIVPNMPSRQLTSQARDFTCKLPICPQKATCLSLKRLRLSSPSHQSLACHRASPVSTELSTHLQFVPLVSALCKTKYSAKYTSVLSTSPCYQPLTRDQLNFLGNSSLSSCHFKGSGTRLPLIITVDF